MLRPWLAAASLAWAIAQQPAAAEGVPAVAAAASDVQPAVAAALAPRVVPGLWVVMGSSSAMGAGAGVGRGWAWLLQAQMHERGVSLINLAKSGTTSYAGLSAVQPSSRTDRPPSELEINIDTALTLVPSLLIISYPSNDTALGFGAEETVANILAIRQRAQQRKVPVIVVSSQPRRLPAAQLDTLARIDTQLREAIGPCFVEVYNTLAGPNGQMGIEIDAGDGIHPNTTGHARIYDQVRRLLDSQQCVRITRP